MSHKRSVLISRLLNDLGYSKEMVQLRQCAYESMQTEYTSLCGSKREGLSLPFENDMDLMSVYRSMECQEVFDCISRNGVMIKFQLERHHSTAPGYALLKCVSLDHTLLSEIVRYCLVEGDKGVYLLSSDSWRQRHKEIGHSFYSSPGNDGIFTQSRDNQGPSSPLEYLAGLCSYDNVVAIRSHCPHINTNWRNRRRLHDWPSPELIDSVSSLEAHVVPIGYKDSPLHFLEWRICFTKGEIRLIENLNDCQTKLIILLKMLAKHELKPICKEMSSYVMKNLVLWMAEKYPSKTFTEDRLLVLLRHSLKLLKRCIANKELPSYMIESRNLFADRISDVECRALCKKLDVLLHEGPCMLLRCPKISDGLNLFRNLPDEFCLWSVRRRFLEIANWHINNLSVHYAVTQLQQEPYETIQGLFGSTMETIDRDESCSQLLNIVVDILFPDLSVIGEGVENEFDFVTKFMRVVKERLMYYLS